MCCTGSAQTRESDRTFYMPAQDSEDPAFRRLRALAHTAARHDERADMLAAAIRVNARQRSIPLKR